MTRRRALFVVFAVAGVVAGCIGFRIVEGSGRVVSESRDASLPFTGITVDGSADVSVSRDTVPSIVVETDDNILDFVETKVDGSTLVIGNRDRVILRPTRLRVYVAANTDIQQLTISGSGAIRCTDSLTPQELALRISGSGDLTARVNVVSVQTTVSGSGAVRLCGVASSQDVTVSGSGDYWASELTTAASAVDISGSGDAHVHADSTLNVTVSGSGDVWYTGDPSVTTHVSGSGDVHRQ